MQDVSDIVLFFGRFHPLVVHLPIGFLFFAFILEVLAKFQDKNILRTAIPLALLLGTLSAALACILGYMLSLSGDYDNTALDKHFWFGIITTVISCIAWVLKSQKIKTNILESSKANIASLSFIVLSLSITGHYGGNLTHGSDYLTAYLPFKKEDKELLPSISTIEEAQLFTHVVNPILESKCISCHNSEKKKGGLSLADSLSILQGGKNGTVLIPGNSSQSELIKRVVLDHEDDKFMPPKGKTPLTKEEIKIIEFWILNGNANFDITIGNLNTNKDIKKLIEEKLNIHEGAGKETIVSKGPDIPENVLKELVGKGVRVRELIAQSNLLDVSILPASKEKMNVNEINHIFNQLSKIKHNIIWLSLPDNNINDNHLKVIGTFQKLKKLDLAKNRITDLGLNHLTDLDQLESINLYNNVSITEKSFETLSKIKNLKKVYVWGTAVKKSSINKNEENINLPIYIL